jgi:maltose alpha-D-glucosyltransferase/alpha-amylase
MPVEVLGRVPFPVISDVPYTIALGPYGFLWFELTDPAEETIR